MADRTRARQLAAAALQRGDPTGWFEELYSEAEAGTSVVPWADRFPNPLLVEFLDRAKISGSALVVGCGYGDDAEELARRGFRVTAFDVAASAVAKCRERFPRSAVNYEVADVLHPPESWTGAFDLVVEISTLHLLPPAPRAAAQANIARFPASGGILLVIARGREHDEPEGQMPWPLTRGEMVRFESLGLSEVSFEDILDGDDPPVRRFRAAYAAIKPADAPTQSMPLLKSTPI